MKKHLQNSQITEQIQNDLDNHRSNNPLNITNHDRKPSEAIQIMEYNIKFYSVLVQSALNYSVLEQRTVEENIYFQK